MCVTVRGSCKYNQSAGCLEGSGENPFTLFSEQQAEVGEGMMMISYGYSGAGKTTTLPPA